MYKNYLLNLVTLPVNSNLNKSVKKKKLFIRPIFIFLNSEFEINQPQKNSLLY